MSVHVRLGPVVTDSREQTLLTQASWQNGISCLQYGSKHCDIARLTVVQACRPALWQTGASAHPPRCVRAEPAPRAESERGRQWVRSQEMLDLLRRRRRPQDRRTGPTAWTAETSALPTWRTETGRREPRLATEPLFIHVRQLVRLKTKLSVDLRRPINLSMNARNTVIYRKKDIP